MRILVLLFALVLVGVEPAFAQATAVIEASSLRLRAKASSRGAVLGAYRKGTKVRVLSTHGSWSKVKVGSRTGFMASKYLQRSSRASTGSSTVSTPPASSGGAYRVSSTRGLRLRSKPSVKGKLVAVLKNGTSVTVLSRANAPWWKCRAQGKTGFVWNTFLTKGPGTAPAATEPRSTKPRAPGSNAGSPSGGSINRKNLSGLRPGFRGKIERILRRMTSLGWKPYVAEGIRTRAQQRKKVQRGFSKTMNSYHLHGLAADIVDRRYGWKIGQGHRYWRDLGRAAAAEGLTWGGNWRSFKDVAHVQARSRSAN